MQLFRCCLGFRPALHVQLVENVADVGLHRGQLHVHDLCNLGVGLVRTEQMENLQFRGRQLLAGSKAGFEEMRVERRLRPPRQGRRCACQYGRAWRPYWAESVSNRARQSIHGVP